DAVDGPLPLGPDDVLLVTGGGKGIAAECALALARETGVRLVLLGRARPEDDPALATNLCRLPRAGATARYYAVDVLGASGVAAAVRDATRKRGRITAVLHGAGTNVPRLIAELDTASVLRTVAPKVDGARNVLDALDPAALRLFVMFGSLIARTGLTGEA